MLNFVALVHADENGYGAVFPDLPGCVTAGDTLDELYEMAVEAISLHLEGMIRHKEPIPEPMTLQDALKHEFYEDAVSTFITRVGRPDKQERVNIMIPESDLLVVDRAARRVKASRSSFMVQASVEKARVMEERL